MPNLYVQQVIPHRNLMPADAVVNTFHFTGLDDTGDMISAIIGRLNAFWTDVPAGPSNALNTFMSGELNLPGTRIKVYDLSDPKPRAPIADESLGLSQGTPVNTQNLPSEVALCSSYRGPLESGQSPARRRGRIYIGPLNVGAAAGTGTTISRPSAAFRATVAAASRDLAEASTLGCAWAVWSGVNEGMTIIEYGWVDDAFDTQRRRGAAATTRSNWQVETPPA